MRAVKLKILGVTEYADRLVTFGVSSFSLFSVQSKH